MSETKILVANPSNPKVPNVIANDVETIDVVNGKLGVAKALQDKLADQAFLESKAYTDQIASATLNSVETAISLKADKSYVDTVYGQTKIDNDAVKNALEAADVAETQARIDADNALDARIGTLEGTVPTLATKAEVASEVAARESLDSKVEQYKSELATSISDEVTARQTADATLRTDFQSADSALDAKVVKEIADRTQAILDEEDARTLADEALQTAINNEISNRTQADSALDSKIDAEIANRTNSDITINVTIDSKESESIARDTAIQNSLAQEVTDRQAADAALTTRLDGIESGAGQDIDELRAGLAQELLDRAAADNAINTKNSEQDTAIANLQSGVANVQSNLDTAYGQLSAKDAQIEATVSTLTSDLGALSARHDSELETERQARLAQDDLKMDKAGGAFSGPVDMSGNALNNLPAATLGSQPATYAQLQESIGNLSNDIGSRQSCKCFTNDVRLVEGVDLSSILPFSDDEAPTTIAIADLAVGDYILADTNTPKLFKVIDDGGVKKATLVNVEQPAEGYNYFVAWDLVNTPASNENATLQGIRAGRIIKIADFNFAFATGVNLSATYAKALEKSSIQASDTIEAAISKLDKNLDVAQSELQSALDAAIALEVSNRNTAINTAQTALQSNIDAETAARIAEDAKKLDLAGGTMTGDINMNDKKLVNVNTIEGKKVTTGVALVNGTKVRIAKFVSSNGITINGAGGGLEFTYRTDIPSITNPAFVYYNGKNDLSAGDEFYAAYAGFNSNGNYGTHISAFDADNNEVFRVVPSGSNFYFAMFTSANVDYFGPYGTRMTTFASQSTTESPVLFSTGIDAGGKVIPNVGDAVNGKDAVNKDTLMAAISAVTGGATANLGVEVQERIDADAALQAALDAEIATRTSADTSLQNAIDLEFSQRTQAITDAKDELNAIIAGGDANEALLRQTEDAALDAKITTEKNTREAADSALQTSLDSEVTARQNADTALQAALSNEIAAREALAVANVLEILATMPIGTPVIYNSGWVAASSANLVGYTGNVLVAFAASKTAGKMLANLDCTISEAEFAALLKSGETMQYNKDVYLCSEAGKLSFTPPTTGSVVCYGTSPAFAGERAKVCIDRLFDL